MCMCMWYILAHAQEIFAGKLHVHVIFVVPLPLENFYTADLTMQCSYGTLVIMIKIVQYVYKPAAGCVYIHIK